MEIKFMDSMQPLLQSVSIGHVLSDMDTITSLYYGTTHVLCFNWATSFQTWILYAASYGCRQHSGFNWATTFQPWIRREMESVKDPKGKVSIGPRPFRHGYRNNSSFEVKIKEVSIGPRPFRHGYSRHFSAFTAIGKKPIFAHTVNFYEYF